MNVIQEFTHNFKKLTKTEELELVAQAKAGDTVAMRKLINSVTPLIARMARQRAGIVPLPDLLSEGILALYHSLTKFDTSFDVRWSTYVMRKNGWVDFFMTKSTHHAHVILGSTESCRGKSNMEVDSMDAPVHEESLSLHEIIADAEQDELADTTVTLTVAKLESIIANLKDVRAKTIMERRMAGITYRDIGDEIHVSHETVRIVERKTMKLIRTVAVHA